MLLFTAAYLVMLYDKLNGYQLNAANDYISKDSEEKFETMSHNGS